MKTTVVIKNMKVSCILGVSNKERKMPQMISITIRLIIDGEKASRTDALIDTVNYRKIYDNVILLIENSHFHLLEALGGAIIDVCLENKRVLKVMVTIAKFNKLEKADCAVLEIEKDNE